MGRERVVVGDWGLSVRYCPGAEVVCADGTEATHLSPQPGGGRALEMQGLGLSR